jgi:predicted acetyltransferase
MEISIIQVPVNEKEILRNLMEKYLYEFTQYDNLGVNNLGLCGYDYIDQYWTEENRFAYFIRVDGWLAGFMMVNDVKEINVDTNYSMAEFFVIYKYRKSGVGTYAVNYALNKFKGKWQIRYHPKNITSKNFWNKIVNEYTNGKYEIIKDNIDAKYNDGTTGEVLIFET